MNTIEYLLSHTKSLDGYISHLVDENFWDLV